MRTARIIPALDRSSRHPTTRPPARRRPRVPLARIATALAVAASVAVPLHGPVAEAAPSIVTGGPFTYVEQAEPLDIGTGTVISGDNFYDGKYIDFEITGATADEDLALRTVSTPSVAVGEVSVVGTAIYVGNGTSAVPVGSIDAVNTGLDGQKLRINFGSDFRNAGFETGEIAPWTAMNQFIELGVTSIAGFVTQDTSTYPVDSGGDSDVPASASYSVALTSADPPNPTEGTYALGLTSSMTTSNNCDVVHGPGVYSAAFDAAAGQTLSFDWRAYAGGDAYHVFGYLLNTATGAQTEVLDEYTTNTSGTTDWVTKSVQVPTTGTYRFVFVSGTYDASCGRAAGASLYVDNFQVVSASFVNDEIVSEVAGLLTYSNESEDPAGTREVTATTRNVIDETASGVITISITPVNDVPVGTPATVSWINTAIVPEQLERILGTLEFSDPDGPSVTFGIVDGTTGSFDVGGVAYDVEKVGSYGTLYVNASTGAYVIAPRTDQIDGVAQPAVEVFTVSASDGTDTGTTSLTLGILLPPAPRNVVASPANGQATVTWVKPLQSAGVSGYEVTSSPDGQTCSTVGVDSVSCVVSGLTNGTAYTFTVVPTTETGVGTTSLPSDPVTPVGPPTAPLSVQGTPGDGRVLVTWDPPANDGGSTVTSYQVTSSPGGGSCSTTGATNCTVLGLAVGTTYTFTVTATNALGTSPVSETATVTLRNATTTTLVAAPSPAAEGAEVTLTATVTGSSPSGTVEFFDGSTSLGTATIQAGIATLTTSALTAGSHQLTSHYDGDELNNPSTSSARTLVVNAPATWSDQEIALELQVGVPYDDAVLASGYPAPSYEVTDGALPDGLVLDPETGAITGTPTTAGPYSFTITASNAEGDPITVTFEGTIDAATPAGGGGTGGGGTGGGGTGGGTGDDTDDDPETAVSGGFTALDPLRVLDTRRSTPITAGSVRPLGITSAWELPDDAIAVTLNVTAVDPIADGHLTVYSCSTSRPRTSVLNYTAGQTVANMVVVAVDAGMQICTYSHAQTHVVIDLDGVYRSEGGDRLDTHQPRRVLDTRPDDKLAAGEIVTIAVAPPGVASGADLNVTVDAPEAAGHLTVFPCGTDLPTASNLNHGPGQTVANHVAAKVSEQGTVCVFTLAPTHLVVDLTGLYHQDGTSQLAVQTPERILDTRSGTMLAAGSTLVLQLTDETGPDAPRAAALNVTVTQASGPGHLTVYPCSAQGRPRASNLNYAAGSTIANHVTAGIGDRGGVCIYTHAAIHLVVDVEGTYHAVTG